MTEAEWIEVESNFERVAAHEAGHVTIGLSFGAKIKHIERLAPDSVPGVLREQNFQAGLGVEFTESIRKLEPRFQFLVGLGGVTGEKIVFGRYDEAGAAADFDALKANPLTPAEIEGLIEIARRILRANSEYFDWLRAKLTKRLGMADRILAVGAALNVRFQNVGRAVNVFLISTNYSHAEIVSPYHICTTSLSKTSLTS